MYDGPGASLEGISRLLRKWFTRDHTKISVLAVAADDSDDTSEDDDGAWCYCQIAKDGSMNHEWLYVHVMPEDEKVPRTNTFVPIAIL